MSTINSLIQQSLELETALIEAGGELTPDLEEQIKNIGESLSDKADRIGFVLDRLASSCDLYNAKAEEYKAIAKRCDEAHSHVKQMILHLLESTNQDVLEGQEVTFKRSLTPGAVVITNDAEVPEEYKRVVTTTSIDKAKIQADLKSGMPCIPGAILERKYSLKQSITKPKELAKPKAKKGKTDE